MAGELNQVDIAPVDLNRMAELMHKYMGFPLGVANASVIAAAELAGWSGVRCGWSMSRCHGT